MKDLKEYTQARVSLGSAGDSLPTAPLLALPARPRKGRDAVRIPFDTITLRERMAAKGWPSIVLESAVSTREQYLRRPDLGCRLSEASAKLVQGTAGPQPVVFVIADGLSASAAEQHAAPLLDQVFATLPHRPGEDNPIVVVKQGRVAIGDEIGEQLGAVRLALLIGERPGLSSPDSLGAYLTWRPRLGRTNAERNCVSNIHSDGLSYEKAAHKIVFLLQAMERLEASGVSLKDTSSAVMSAFPSESQ